MTRLQIAFALVVAATLSHSHVLAQCETWQPLGAGVPGGFWPYITTMAVHNGDLLVSGHDLGFSGWNGSSWYSLPDTSGDILVLTEYNGELIAGGAFISAPAGGQTANSIARWDGTSWQTLGQGVQWASGNNAVVYALTIYNGELIVAGDFASAGGQPATRIARWNGMSWQALGTGLSGGWAQVNALTVYNGELIAAGYFTMAGAQPANYIARWNGATWQPLGAGVNDTVNAVTVYNGELIVAGGFTMAGGQPANYVARWNDKSWQPLGTGMDFDVYALTVFNGDLIAGGPFHSAGGQSANNVARWDGSTWQPMGTGMNNWIAAFTVYGGELVAGGAFTMAEGSTVNRIARWQDCLDPIAGDADGDGQVDVDDLIAVMLAWGPCPAPPETCLEDVNVDGQVNVDDLVIVILNWSA